jgi:hypothetical protein
MADTEDQTKAFFDWVQRMWTPEAYGLPGASAMSATAPPSGIPGIPGVPGFAGMPGLFTPTTDPKELERRIAELQAVEGWLRMNVGFIQMTVKTLELQKSALESITAMSPGIQPK